MPSSTEGGSWLAGIPVRTARLRIWALRLIFPRRWYVQLRKSGDVYVLREPK